MLNLRFLLHPVIWAFLIGCCTRSISATDELSRPEKIGYRLVQQHPHNTQHFTQGLVFSSGKLIESTGRYGESAIYSIDPGSDKTSLLAQLGPAYFGEGLAELGGRFFQLSWKEGTGFIYDRQFKLLGRFAYPGEGWGLTTLPTAGGERLAMSDGSPVLRLLDPASMKESGRITVRRGIDPVFNINELEYAQGRIYANIWLTNFIVAIDPDSGQITGYMDFSALVRDMKKPPGWDASEHVLNGIAYDPQSGHFFVTGKCWPALFEIEVERSRPAER